MLCCMCVSVSRSVVCDSVTPRIVAHQAPLSMGFSRQEYWSEVSFPSPGDLPDPGILLHCRQSLYCLNHQGSPDVMLPEVMVWRNLPYITCFIFLSFLFAQWMGQQNWFARTQMAERQLTLQGWENLPNKTTTELKNTLEVTYSDSAFFRWKAQKPTQQQIIKFWRSLIGWSKYPSLQDDCWANHLSFLNLRLFVCWKHVSIY